MIHWIAPKRLRGHTARRLDVPMDSAIDRLPFRTATHGGGIVDRNRHRQVEVTTMRITSNTLRGYRVWLPLHVDAGRQTGGRFISSLFRATEQGKADALALAQTKEGFVKCAWGYLRDLTYSDLNE
jgi:hypothetical protein